VLAARAGGGKYKSAARTGRKVRLPENLRGRTHV
jgi:hypothetical protein